MSEPVAEAIIPAETDPAQGVAVGTTRVLHVINGEHYAGAERVQDLLAAELPGLGFEVGLACLKPDRFPKLRHATDAPLYELPMRHRFDLRVVWRLARLVRREGYELLHAHTARSALVASAASIVARVPLVHHVHSPTAADSTRRWRARINAWVERMSLRRASALIAVSNSLKQHVRERGFDDELISVVPNGVPCRAATPACDGPKAEWTLGTVALFRPRKGIEVLLKALVVLRSQGIAVRLRAVGGFETGEYEREVKSLAGELALNDCIEWTGFTRDVDTELARMDLFVLPSLFGEGLPMVVLEAMAAGVAVVATRVEGTPEAIRDGRDGLIAEPDDPKDLAAAIARITSGQVDWHTLRTNARRRQAERFSEKAMAAGVAEVYRRVLGGRFGGL
ncbi:MAG: glycosyltransferase [Candidatus Nealsonbacteria bacterium]|nr:glycosyltransferase [Candidatus Nealsonbacteria bacterium]